MDEWIIIAAPLLILAVVLTLGFVGCEFDTSGIHLPDSYRVAVAQHPSIVSYWRLDDVPFQDEPLDEVRDSTGGNFGKYKGGVTRHVAGLLHNNPNDAVRFDGTSGYVSVPYNATLNPAKFTIEALVTIAGGNDTRRAVVSSLASASAAGGWKRQGYMLCVSPENRWEAWVGDGTQNWQVVTVGKPNAVKVTDANERGPYYIAMTYDGTNLTLYVNPVDQGDLDQVASKAVGYHPNESNELRIGAADPDGQPSYFFDGKIDEVAVYKDALDFNTLRDTHFLTAMLQPLTFDDD